MVVSRQHLGEIISKTIKCHRLSSKMSQEDMAHHLWVTVSEYQSLEQGRIKDPRISTVFKIALRLGWSLDKMFGLNGQKNISNAFEVI